ncbi:MAG: translocation/assembly module TamB domain-containing protein, partial [Flavobacteriaceae bacterium]
YVEDYKKDTLFSIGELSTSILNLKNLRDGRLEFGDIEVDDLNFILKTYMGETDTNLDVFIDKLDDGTPRDPGTPPFYLSSSNINVKSGSFKYIDENLETQKVLDFRKLAISANDFLIVGPEVGMDVQNMAFMSSRGIPVERMHTRFQYSKERMQFDSLLIQTPKSRVKGMLKFMYDRKDFSDFVDKVQLQAQFNEASVSSDELNLYYDEFGSGKVFDFASGFSGTLNDLVADVDFLQTEDTGIRGTFNFKNLFSDEAPFFMGANMRNVTTSYYELRGLLPRLLGTNLPLTLSKFGQFTVRGNADVTETSVNAKVNIATALGTSYADLQLNNVDDNDEVTYKGFVSLMDFDLARLLDNQKLGKTTMDVNVEGNGFVRERLNTEVIGKVYTIGFNGYTYEDLNVSGIIKDQLFDGSLMANDENVKFDFKGLVDFAEERNNFNFVADVAYADLKKLNFINDSVSIFKGHIDMDASGNTLDDLVGEVRFRRTSFQNKNDTYYFNDFEVTSSFENDSLRTIQINSPDIITGFVTGNFKVGELGRLVQNSIGTIYTNYSPYKISSGQRLNFNFNIYNKIVDVFFPEVKFDPNTFIRGKIVADEGDFKLSFKSPSIAAYGTQADAIELQIDNKNPLFNTFMSVGDLSTPYYDVKDFNLINTTLKDTLFFRTEFKGGSEYNDSYNLNFYHTFNKDNKSVIGLKTSDVNFKGNKWILNKDGDSRNKVIVNKSLDSITIQEIVMNNEVEEQIRLRGQLADSTYKDLQLQFKIVSLEKITPAIDSLHLEGEVNGILNILQKDNIYLPSSNLGVSDFSVNGMRLGDLTMGIVGNRDLTEFTVNTQITNNGVESLGVFGKINNRGEVPEADLMANLTNFRLEPFSPLGEGVITNIRGLVNGSARIRGEAPNPEISGLLTLDQAGLSIPELNVDYAFAPYSRVNLYGQTFDFDKIAVKDVAMNTKATLNGTISHDHFDVWNLDLHVDTKEDRLLVLNTEFTEESLYYGTAFIRGEGRIYGPTNALTIKVIGDSAEGSSLKIPLSDVATVGDYSFIDFVEKGETIELESERVLDEYEGLELDFDLNITPDAELEIITDRKTGSTLRGTGAGLVLLRINTLGKFEMYGDFVVVNGEYNYRFG